MKNINISNSRLLYLIEEAVLRFSKRNINRLLRKFGFEIRRASSFSNFSENIIKNYKTPTAEHVIEFIGPSGVGKTTLFNIVKNQLNFYWAYSIEDKGGSKIDLPEFIDYQKIYSALLFEKNRNIEINHKEFLHSTNLIKFFIINLTSDSRMVSSDIFKNIGFFLDDGVFHNFSKELLFFSARTENKERFKKFVNNRSFIHMTASTDFILENLKKRNSFSPNAANNWLRYIGEKNISNHIKKNLSVKAELAAQLENNGCMVKHIDAETHTTKLITEILKFEKYVISCKNSKTHDI